MRPISILLIEDEPAIALHLRGELEQAGLRVLSATNAEDALDVCAKNHPEVAILNFLQNETTDGMTLARLLHQQFGVKTLFLTGARRCDLEASPDFDPARAVLFKPFTRRQLRAFLSGVK